MSTLNIDNIADQAGIAGPDFVAMPTVAGDPVVESGSNSDGEWTRWADGTQYCGRSLSLTYENSSTLAANWTFPAAFSGGSVRPSHQPDSVGLASTTPNLADMALTSAQEISTTSVRFQQRRINGGTNFAPGDSANTRALCFGRWK